MTGVAIYHLAVRCPDCGCPPRLRGTDFSMSSFRDAPQEAVVLTYRCHKEFRDGRTCGKEYEITAKHFTQAR